MASIPGIRPFKVFSSLRKLPSPQPFQRNSFSQLRSLQALDGDTPAKTDRLPESSEALALNDEDSHVTETAEGEDEIRLPRSVQAVYLRPLKRRPRYGVPTCDLQLRSYSAQSVEFFADFALRAAYYLELPARGPIPLPRIINRWTVPRSNFAHKKSQENFERITMRRLIQIQDGHPDVVQMWLSFLQKHQYHGVGMKANVWNFEKLGVGKTMDVSMENVKRAVDPKWQHFGRKKNLATSEKVMEMLGSETFGQPAGSEASK